MGIYLRARTGRGSDRSGRKSSAVRGFGDPEPQDTDGDAELRIRLDAPVCAGLFGSVSVKYRRRRSRCEGGRADSVRR